MSLRPKELRLVADEVRAALAGAFVQKAHAPLPRLCFLELRLPGRSVRLCLSAEPAFARLSVTKARFPSPPEPPPFQRWLRRELVGAKLLDVTTPDPFAVQLHFEQAGKRRALFAHLRGTGANLVLLDPEGRVLAASHPDGERTRPGATWEVEPTAEDDPARGLPVRLEPRAGTELPYAEAAEDLFGEKERARRAQEIRKRLQGPLRAKLGRLDRTLLKVAEEAARTEEARSHHRLGELLAQNLHTIQRGAKEVALTEWTASGPQELKVTLDPRRTPKEEVAWRFHQYRRLTRGVEHAERRRVELEAERAALAAELEAIEAREDDALLEHLELLARPQKKGPERGKPYKVFLTAAGQRILVGRSAEGNDEVTFRAARPFDLWLHARGVPGSHVVLECRKNQEVPQEALLDAATLAHYHSQRKSEPRGEVAYTQVKFVKRQKGGGPGQVTYTRDRSLVIRVEPLRLERLLATVG